MTGEPDPAGPDSVAARAEDLATLSALRRSAHRTAWIYAIAAAALMPWIAYLAVSLPKRDVDTHYNAAWVGFDLLLAFAVVRTAYMAFRVDPRVQLAATATATLLIVDAWFDVTTAGGRAATMEAILLAFLVEIPAAIFSLYLAHRVSTQVFHLAHLERLTAEHHDGQAPAPDRPPARLAPARRLPLSWSRLRPARAPRR